jgi:hypothetical protein
VSDLQPAITIAAFADADEFEYAYWSALAEGADDTRSCPDHERQLGALRLLTLAGLRLPDLALQTCVLDVRAPCAPDAVDVALESACHTSAGALRLAHRALEAHGQTVGYAPLAWIIHARERAHSTLAESQSALLEGGPGPLYTHVRRIAVALARASAATADDDLCVAEESATALAHLLALYMIATAAIGASPPPPA